MGAVRSRLSFQLGGALAGVPLVLTAVVVPTASAAAPPPAAPAAVLQEVPDAPEPSVARPTPAEPNAADVARANAGSSYRDSSSVLESRTETTETYRNPDGTRTVKVFTEPVAVETAPGVFTRSDTALVAAQLADLPAAARGNGRPQLVPGVKPRLHPLAPVFGADDSGGLLAAQRGGVSVRMSATTPDGSTSRPTTDATPDAGQRTEVLFGDALGAVDAKYTVTPSQVKELLLVPTRADVGSGVWSFTLDVAGGTAALDDLGGIVVRNAAGETTMALPRPVGWDSSPAPQGGAAETLGSYGLTPLSASSYRVEIRFSLAWLTDARRVFPLQLDPTLQTGTGYDTSQSYKSDGALLGGQLRTGNPLDAGKVWRSGARFPYDSLRNQNNLVVGSQIQVINEDGTANSHPSALWDLTNFNFNGAGTLRGSGPFDGDVTYADGAMGDRLRTLFVGNVDDDNAWWFFTGDEAQGTYSYKASRASMYLTLNRPPSQPVLTPLGGSEEKANITPRLAATSTDPDGDQVQYRFNVYNTANGTGTVIWSSGWTMDNNVTVPDGILAPGTTFSWRADSRDSCRMESNPCGQPAGFATFKTSGHRHFVTAPLRLGAMKGSQFFDRALTDRTTARVNLASGDLVIQASDLGMSAPGVSPQTTRTYNSLAGLTTGVIGPGWRLEPGRTTGRVEVVGGVENFVYTAGDGARYVMPRAANDEVIGGVSYPRYTAPAELGADLRIEPNPNRHVLTFRSTSTKLTFRDTDGMLVAVTDRNGVAQSFNYETVLAPDGLPYLASVTDTVGRTHPQSRTTLVNSSSDSSGRVVNYSYTSGRLTSVMDADGKTTSYGYNSVGLLSSITTPEGRLTTVTYDLAKRVRTLTQRITTTPLDEAVTTFTYFPPTAPGAADTAKTIVTDDNLHATTYITDQEDRIVKVVDALNHDRVLSYSPANDVETSTDAMGFGGGTANVTTNNYDDDNRFEGTAKPEGGTSTVAYADKLPTTFTGQVAHWQPNEGTDPAGNKAAYGYDAPGNIQTVQDTTDGPMGGQMLTFDYNDPAPAALTCGGKPGQLCQVKNGNGKATNYAYNALGELIGEGPPAPLGASSYTYDTASRTASATDGKGQTTRTNYDPLDRVTRLRFNGVISCTSTDISAGQCITYTYDGDGAVKTMTDQTGTTTYSYDGLGREISRTLPGTAFGSGMSTLKLDGVGNVLEATQGGETTRYSYNEANQLVRLAEPGGSCTATPRVRCTEFVYDNNGRRTQTFYPTTPNVTLVQNTLDKDGRPTRMLVQTGSTVHQDLQYSYKQGVADKGQVQTRTDALAVGTAGKTTTYTYDTLAQLDTVVERNALNTANTATWDYDYDGAGNRLRSVVNGTATNYGYNDANQLISRNGNPAGYAYDANGNETGALGASTRTGGVYNSKDQFVNGTVSGSATAYTYTDASQGVRLSAGGTAFRPTAQGLVARSTAGNAQSFIRDSGGTLAVLRTGSATSGASYYYAFDNLGSVTALYNASGTKVNSYNYDPYGVSRSKIEAVDNPFEYIGGYLDNGTGLYKLGIRYYDPSLGRFTQIDPTGQDPHYTYAGNDPINSVDPSGALSFSVEGCAIVCIEGSIDIDFDEGVDFEGGSVEVRAGAEFGVGGGVSTELTGSAEGPYGVGECSAGPASISGTGSESGLNAELSADPGVGVGCSLGAGYEFSDSD